MNIIKLENNTEILAMYDTTFVIVDMVTEPTSFLSDEIESIEVNCSSEYNGVAAGTNQNSHFNFYAMSMYPFIQSGVNCVQGWQESQG